MKKTKIVSTIGPSTDSEEKMKQLVDAGVDVARLNFSHVSHDEHGEVFDRIRSVSDKVAVMIDTKGPEIRLRKVEEGTVLENGSEVEITTEEIVGSSDVLSVNYSDLLNHLTAGAKIMIDDGKIELEVEEVGETAQCIVIHGGEISSRKAINIPGRDIGLQAPTEKDKDDIRFAAKKGFDLLSVSFVKEARDIERIRDILDEEDSEMQIISKIEHAKAIENLDDIIKASDGLMVARGDLGVEVPAAKLPMLQKEIIKKANKQGKPVITATQMLESMTDNPTATRAEISDVANAVIDGTDAVMLSGETAVGRYPIKTVRFMSEVVSEVEDSIKENVHHTVKQRSKDTAEIISKNVWQAARDSDSRYIVAHTSSGTTARNIAKYRPKTPIIAVTDSRIVERQLNLVWGVKPFYRDSEETMDEMLYSSAKYLLDSDLVEKHDKLVLSAGLPKDKRGITNMMMIRTVESLINGE